MKPKIRKVAFTDLQMLKARDSGKFTSHRHFVSWLFESQHNCHVERYRELIHDRELDPKNGKLLCHTVTGLIGHAIVEK
jgi:hypothetical protein